MVTESLYSPQNLHICSQIFCTAALIGDSFTLWLEIRKASAFDLSVYES